MSLFRVGSETTTFTISLPGWVKRIEQHFDSLKNGVAAPWIILADQNGNLREDGLAVQLTPEELKDESPELFEVYQQATRIDGFDLKKRQLVVLFEISEGLGCDGYWLSKPNAKLDVQRLRRSKRAAGESAGGAN